MPNAHEQRVREDLTEILQSRGLEGGIVDDLVDALSALVSHEKRGSFIDGLKRARQEAGGQRPYRSTSARGRQVETSTGDEARRTRSGHALRYSSAVQGGVIKRASDAPQEGGR